MQKKTTSKKTLIFAQRQREGNAPVKALHKFSLLQTVKNSQVEKHGEHFHGLP